ncbi:MAG TPA: T9SS type A sorting domain-containing protein [Mariniflexile sp.]
MIKYLIFITSCLLAFSTYAQSDLDIVIDIETKYQKVEGFGAALAYYENWLIAHPNKSEIYDAIFGELSLDILRVRNAYDYDPTMIDRVVEFYNAAENSLGQPIKILSTSWGPPAYLKSNNDRKNGGSLKYNVNESIVEFDYAGFANWWNESLDEYNENGVYPDYISIQNEPDFDATWESCLFTPTETVNATDTIAGYNKALEAIYNIVEQRDVRPKIIGPESIGIGYNSVQNYVNALKTSYIYGIAHHLYHGVDENNPWVSTSFSEVGSLHPEMPHFQTEFGRGDWFALAGLMHKSFSDENVAAYLYWDLVWDGSGLINIESPWDQSLWTTENGYIKTKEFYAFKQYSAFIHPNWIRINSSNVDENIKTLAFINQSSDSITMIMVNRSETENINVSVSINDFNFNQATVYRTSESEDCSYVGVFGNSDITLPKKSITTVQLTTGDVMNIEGVNHSLNRVIIYPNPVSEYATIKLPKNKTEYDFVSFIDVRGRVVIKQRVTDVINQKQELTINCSELTAGLYYCKIESIDGESFIGKFIVTKD